MIRKAHTIGQDEATAAIDHAIALAKSRFAPLSGAEIENVSGGGVVDRVIVFGGNLLGVIKQAVMPG